MGIYIFVGGEGLWPVKHNRLIGVSLRRHVNQRIIMRVNVWCIRGDMPCAHIHAFTAAILAPVHWATWRAVCGYYRNKPGNNFVQCGSPGTNSEHNSGRKLTPPVPASHETRR
jgi:hypothetical protein